MQNHDDHTEMDALKILNEQLTVELKELKETVRQLIANSEELTNIRVKSLDQNFQLLGKLNIIIKMLEKDSVSEVLEDFIERMQELPKMVNPPSENFKA